MCGIAAIYSYSSDAPPVDQEELLKIREYMVSRGPDSGGLWVSENRRVGSGHQVCRLDLGQLQSTFGY